MYFSSVKLKPIFGGDSSNVMQESDVYDVMNYDSNSENTETCDIKLIL